MRKLFFIVVCVFFTQTTFAQTEKQQKVQKRVERDHKPVQNNNNTNNNGNSGRPIIITPSPYYNSFYFNNPYRFDYPYYDYRYNRYDYRWNSNVNTPRTTVNVGRGAKVRFGLGIVSSVNRQLPLTVGPKIIFGGDKTYFSFSYQLTSKNPYSHYDNITLEDVIGWGDEFLGTFYYVRQYDIGFAGKVSEELAITFTIGNLQYDSYRIYNDEYFVLSDSGEYTINSMVSESVTFAIGADYHINNNIMVTGNVGVVGPKVLSLGLVYQVMN